VMDQVEQVAGRVLITIVTLAPLIFYAFLLVVMWRWSAAVLRELKAINKHLEKMSQRDSD
jgi:HAMP domain-containing protein